MLRLLTAGSALSKIETTTQVKSYFSVGRIMAGNFIHKELVLNANQYFKLL